MEQLQEEDVAVFGACSLYGGVDGDQQNWKHCQLSRQRRHTECIEKSLLFYWSIWNQALDMGLRTSFDKSGSRL